MERVKLGTSGLEVSRLCLGAWNFAGGEGWGPDDDRASINLIHHALDSGCNFIDTARAYGRGHSEEVVGEAIRDRRDSVVVATKMVHCPPEQVEPEIDKSLAGLRTDYVDLYICHWPRPSLPLEPFFESMVAAKQKGKIRAIGVSNFDSEQMRAAMRFGACSLQPPLSILWRVPDETMDFCRANGVAVTPYSPLAQGLLTGRYTRGQSEITGIRKNNQLFGGDVFPRALEVARKLDGIADALGCTSAQAALAWVLRAGAVAAPIVGASSPEQWDQNLEALGVELPQDDYDLLDREGRAVWDLLGPDESMWGWKPT